MHGENIASLMSTPTTSPSVVHHTAAPTQSALSGSSSVSTPAVQPDPADIARRRSACFSRLADTARLEAAAATSIATSAPASRPPTNERKIEIECFYCLHHMRPAEEFVFCAKCRSWYSCKGCWYSKEKDIGAKGRTQPWLCRRARQVMKDDQRRFAEKGRPKRWATLMLHGYTKEHADFTDGKGYRIGTIANIIAPSYDSNDNDSSEDIPTTQPKRKRQRTIIDSDDE